MLSTATLLKSDRLPDEVMVKLFQSLDKLYPGAFMSQFKRADVMREHRDFWAGLLFRAMRGMSGPEIAARLHHAIDQCIVRHPDWPPKPGQFVALLGVVPDYRQLFDRAQNIAVRRLSDPYFDPKLADPVLYWAMVEFGASNLSQATWGRDGEKWSRLIDKYAAKGEAIEPVPVIEERPRLVAPGKQSLNREKAHEELQGFLKTMRERSAVLTGEPVKDDAPLPTPAERAAARARILQQIDDMIASSDPNIQAQGRDLKKRYS